MPRGKRAGSKMPTADYDAGCRVRSTSTKCPTRKSRTSSSPPISRPENALASRLLFRQFSKSLAKTCKSGSRKALLHLALESRVGRSRATVGHGIANLDLGIANARSILALGQSQSARENEAGYRQRRQANPIHRHDFLPLYFLLP